MFSQFDATLQVALLKSLLMNQDSREELNLKYNSTNYYVFIIKKIFTTYFFLLTSAQTSLHRKVQRTQMGQWR